MKRRIKKGFTIVELVIVIGVIGILSAILIPTFINLTQKADDAALQSNLANAYTAYYADALDSPYIVAEARTEVFLSKKNTKEAAKVAGEYYSCGTDGKWLVSTTAAEKSGYTFESVFIDTSKVALKEYNTYYVYYFQKA